MEDRERFGKQINEGLLLQARACCSISFFSELGGGNGGGRRLLRPSKGQSDVTDMIVLWNNTRRMPEGSYCRI